MIALKLVTGPTSEPITLQRAKDHCRVWISEDDSYISTLITVAREFVEKHCNRALLPQTWKMALDDWPRGDRIKLTRSPLRSVDSVQYTGSDNSGTTMIPGTDYLVNLLPEPGEIVLPFAKVWPQKVLQTSSPIVIQFQCGYDDATKVPSCINHAMLMLVGHWYENREAVVVGRTAQIATEIMFSVEALLESERVQEFGSRGYL